MSRIGIKPVSIPEGVEITIEDKQSRFGAQKVVAKGPLGELSVEMRAEVLCKLDNNEVVFIAMEDTKFAKSLHGLYRSLVANIIDGVTKGFEKKLEMVGIGYKAEIKGNDIELTVGTTHPHLIKAPEGIIFEVNDKVYITVKGIDKQLVGQVAANIRAIQKPEPYRGKGIKYEDEYVRRKAGKTAKASEGGE